MSETVESLLRLEWEHQFQTELERRLRNLRVSLGLKEDDRPPLSPQHGLFDASEVTPSDSATPFSSTLLEQWLEDEKVGSEFYAYQICERHGVSDADTRQRVSTYLSRYAQRSHLVEIVAQQKGAPDNRYRRI